jgi:hypothetical protein
MGLVSELEREYRREAAEEHERFLQENARFSGRLDLVRGAGD